MNMMIKEMKEKYENIEQIFQNLCANSGELKKSTGKFFDIMIDELTLEVIFETHRNARIGAAELENNLNYEITDAAENETLKYNSKKFRGCICTICNCKVLNLFAKHLAKCMGIAPSWNPPRQSCNANSNASKKWNDSGISGISDDEDEDNGGKRKKKRTNNRRVKKSKTSPKKNGQSALEVSALSYDNMSEEEKKTLLMKFCGVVSERTKKICSRSLRCNVHSEEKRRTLRTAVICDSVENAEMVNVDIEGDDDMDTTSLRDLLQDNSVTSSSADSVFNLNNSSSSRKRDRNSKVKSKGSKKDRFSPNVSND